MLSSAHYEHVAYHTCLCQTGWLTGEASDAADMLSTMLRSRLPGLIERNDEQWQRTYACWSWTAANLSVGAAIKVALLQAKPLEDLRCCYELSSLWSHQLADFIEVTGEKTRLVGSYLFYCPIAARIIRSGKVFGASANFGTRHSTRQVVTGLQVLHVIPKQN